MLKSTAIPQRTPSKTTLINLGLSKARSPRGASEAFMTGQTMGGIAAQDDPPLISALVCTCSRDRLVANTVSSILSNTHPNFELIVVDQSRDNETRDALRPFSA